MSDVVNTGALEAIGLEHRYGSKAVLRGLNFTVEPGQMVATFAIALAAAYQRGIEAFHTRLRDFYYPYLFQERPFQKADFEQLPRYQPRPSSASLPISPMLGLLVLAALVSSAAIGRVRALSSSAARDAPGASPWGALGKVSKDSF